MEKGKCRKRLATVLCRQRSTAFPVPVDLIRLDPVVALGFLFPGISQAVEAVQDKSLLRPFRTLYRQDEIGNTVQPFHRSGQTARHILDERIDFLTGHVVFVIVIA